MEHLLEQLVDLVTCDICQTSKDLVVLSCLHRICSTCVSKLPSSKTTRQKVQLVEIRCPFCRRITATPCDDNLLKCRLNVQLQDLIQSYGSTTTSNASTQTDELPVQAPFTKTAKLLIRYTGDILSLSVEPLKCKSCEHLAASVHVQHLEEGGDHYDGEEETISNNSFKESLEKKYEEQLLTSLSVGMYELDAIQEDFERTQSAVACSGSISQVPTS